MFISESGSFFHHSGAICESCLLYTSSLDGSREYMTDQTYELNGFAASAELVFYHGKLGDICFSFAPGAVSYTHLEKRFFPMETENP